MDSEVMERSKKLRVISNYAVGFDNIDLNAATERGIYVTNTPEVLTESVADLALALMLDVARRLNEADRFLRQGKWEGWAPMLLLGNDVYNKTLGIVGLGRIGMAVARRAKGFNMRLLYTDMVRNEKLENELGITYVSLEELLKQSDFISIHVPLLPSTRHMFGEKEFKLMKPTAYLINTSRGPIVDEIALVEALRKRIIGGAGLDVFEKEPVDPDNPLLKLENTVLLPHVASGTIETRTAMANLAVENLISVLQGKMPPSLVNKEVTKVKPLQ
ncbi:MAG: D-glycerate dehydrogenase [Thermoproteota archaeon]|nr:D-glycerate dehydrogenase [Thermoproteota archaeon]